MSRAVAAACNPAQVPEIDACLGQKLQEN